MTITDPRIEAYLLRMGTEPDSRLQAMEEKAKKIRFPIVGPLVGNFLHLVARLKQPRLIVELGSGFGYSAYWFLKGLGADSRIVLIDYSADNIAYARSVLTEIGVADKAEFRAGNALEIGSEYDNVDILFVDVDKYQYLDAIKTMLPRLAPNALVIADNALWGGSVAEDNGSDEDTNVIAKFNNFMFNSGEFLTSIIPLRDGVLLAYRLR